MFEQSYCSLTKNEAVGETVGRDEPVVHSVWVVESQNLEEKCWHSHKTIEPIDP